MYKTLRTEEQVKQELGLKSWRNLSNQDAMRFLSVLPYVDKEVAVKIVEQFPEYISTSKEMIFAMKDLCENILQDASENTKRCISTYEKVLDELAILVEKDDISPADRKYFADKMVEIADKISAKDTEDKSFKKDICSSLCNVFVVSVISIGVSLACNFLGSGSNTSVGYGDFPSSF